MKYNFQLMKIIKKSNLVEVFLVTETIVKHWFQSTTEFSISDWPMMVL
jgi:hypothetical protein